MTFKRMQTITKWVVIVTLFIAMTAPMNQVKAEIQDSFEYENNGNGTATITGYTGMSMDVIIPDEVNGLDVTKVGDGAFSNKLRLFSVVIPSSVTSIGSSAFSNTMMLNTVTIHNDSVIISDNAFNSLKLTIVGHDPSTAKDYADANDYDFREINTPHENSDFEWADNGDGTATITKYKGTDTDVDIPDEIDGLPVTGIGNDAFRVNDSGESGYRNTPINFIEIPDSVTSIGDSALLNNNLRNVSIPDNVKNIGDNAFRKNQLNNLTIPNSVTNIGTGAFRDNKLEKIDIPNSVTNIGSRAFSTNSLTKVIIYNDSVSIGTDAFHTNLPPGQHLTVIGHDPSTAKTYADDNGHAFMDFDTAPEFNYEWTDNKDETATITKYIGDSKDVKIPDRIENVTVTSIGDDAFKGNDLTDVTIPAGIESIGNNAFESNRFSSVMIPGSVTSIGDSAFKDNQLTSVTIEEGTTSIGMDAFKNNQLSTVNIPEGVTNIGKGAFESNELTEVTIPSSVPGIEADTFKDNNLASVTIPASITSIANSAFDDNQTNAADLIITGYVSSMAETYATNNEHTFKGIITADGIDYEWIDNGKGATIVKYTGTEKDIVIPEELKGLTVTGIDEMAFSRKGLTSVKIPESVTSIGALAFAHNDFTSVTIPDNVKELGDEAFSENKLTGVLIPRNVRRIGERAFSYNQLTNVTISKGVQEINHSAFAYNQISKVSIPGSVTFIGNYAFGNNELTKVEILNSEVTIEANPFPIHNVTTNLIVIGYSGSTAERYAEDYSRIFIAELDYEWTDNDDGTATITDYNGKSKDVVVPEKLGGLKVTSIGNSAFKDRKITGVTIPESVTSIDGDAFRGNQLSSVEIPVSVKHIGDQAFYDNQLTSVKTHGKSIIFGKRIFDKNQSNAEDIILIGYSGSTAEKYANNKGHTFIPEFDYTWDVNDEETVTVTGYYGKSKDVEIPDSLDGRRVTGIGETALSLKGLTSVTIPDSVTRIGKQAFSNNKLSSVTIPDGVTYIGSSAFSENQLEHVDIPDGVTSIEKSVFASNELTHVTIPDGVKTIRESAFAGNKLTVVHIPDSVTEIGFRAFLGNDFTSVVLPASVQELGNEVFYMCQKLTSITFMRSDTDIHDDALLGAPLGLTIVGHDPSTAKTYAHDKGYSFANGNGEVSFDPDHSDWVREPLIVSVDIKHYNEEKTLYYGFSDTPDEEPDEWVEDNHINEEKITLPNDKSGEKYVWIKGTGIFGKKFTSVSNAYKLDVDAPIIKVTPDTSNIIHEDLTLTVRTSDDHSGVEKITLPDGSSVKGNEATYTVTENGEYEFSAVDNAGNKATKSIKVDNIDKTISFEKPTISDFDNVTLSKQAQSIYTDVGSVVIKDWREGNKNWRLDVSASPFKESMGGNTLPEGSLKISSVSNVAKVEGEGDKPEILSSGTIDNNDSVSLIQSNNSRGEYEINFGSNALELVVDPTTAKIVDLKGTTYQTTITWDLITGP